MRQVITLVPPVLAAHGAASGTPASLEVRFCGQQSLHPYRRRTAGGYVDGVTGNHVMIDHGNGEYSLYAHLQPGSVRARVGDEVQSGDIVIAR